MNQNNLLKYLVPVIAVIVLAESVLLISRANDKKPVVVVPAVVAPVVTSEPVAKTGDEDYQIVISSDVADAKVGESVDVKVSMLGKVEKSLDSVNVYVKYDPNAVDVKTLEFDKKLPEPAFSKVSTLRSLLVANYLISSPKGLLLPAKDELVLLSFKAKMLKSGTSSFEISTGKEMKESATMIVENGTSKSLTFSANKLMINVTE
ncbi:MAG: hypothetical protein WAV41_03280 [Microgenomates group bacterium]